MHPQELQEQVRRRRTFAIISHPDAGKTTLTEKLLLFGGAIRLAGAVKAKSSQRHASSDWMEIEKQRGISVSTSVLQFDYGGCRINLLDTPGHKDFSEDTYRTLTAADAAVMLIDAAKGVEPQTRKLFEVCRMRGIPIFTFINKLDRPGRPPLELIDELEKVLGIRSCPMSWPLGMGDRFRGVYDRQAGEVLLFEKEDEANVRRKRDAQAVTGVDDPVLFEIAGEGNEDIVEEFKSEVELLEVAGDAFDREAVLAGKLTPVFFGSAMNNFGVQRFLERFIEIAPPPAARKSASGPVDPASEAFSGFVFKIQANMDPNHRDRVAFLRVCSGRFFRGMAATHARLREEFRLSRPVQFFAQEREVIEEAWPGDIVGLLDTSGELRIGDSLYTGSDAIEFEGVPRFSPEHFALVTAKDPMKRKQFKKGIDQLSEEGVVQVYHQIGGLGESAPILGAVGVLQFEILSHRLKGEYGVDVKVERLPYVHARWVLTQPEAPTTATPEEFNRREDTRWVEDRDGQPVVLFGSDWSLRWAEQNHASAKFLKTAPLRVHRGK